MKLIPLALGVLVFTSTGMSQSPETHLLGCADPTKIANALGRLDQVLWENISVERVLSIWPSRLQEIACQSEKGCRILVSQDRVISGHCECCVSFVLQKTDGTPSESLNNIIIHYSARTKGGVVEAAREFARSVGLSSTEATKIGNDVVERFQRFEWKGLRESAQQSYILEVKVTSVGHNWELYLSLGAERIAS